MPLHNTLKSVALAHADDVDKALAFENIHQNAVAQLDHAFCRLARSVNLDANFPHKFHWRKIVLSKVPAHRLGQLLLFHKLNQADLR